MTNIELTLIDEEYLELIVKGHTTSYAIWKYAQNNPTQYMKGISYKNVNKRFNKLINLKLLRPINVEGSIHAAKHYTINKKSIKEYIQQQKKLFEQHISRLEVTIEKQEE